MKKIFVIVLCVLLSLNLSSCVNVVDFVDFLSFTDTDSKLQTAVQMGYYQCALEAINEGADVNKPGGYMRTEIGRIRNLVGQAICCGHEDIAILLVNNGADVNYIGPYKFSILQYAAWGEYDLTELMINKGADIEYICEHPVYMGYNVLDMLFIKCYSNESLYKVADMLVSKGLRITDNTLKACSDAPSVVALSEFAKTHCNEDIFDIDRAFAELLTGNEQTFVDLVKNNSYSDDEIELMMKLASASGTVGMVEALLDAGYKEPDKSGEALHFASYTNTLDVCRALSERGFIQGSYDYFYNTNEDVIRYFIDNETEYDKPMYYYTAGCCSITDIHKYIAEKCKPELYNVSDMVFTAAENGYIDVVDYYLNNGYSLNEIYQDTTIFGYVCMCPFANIDMVEYLLSKGADANEARYVGEPLAGAALSGRCDVAELLIKNGADVNARCDYENGKFSPLPIVYAIEDNNIELVRLLLDNGADINIKDDYAGTTVKEYAARSLSTEIAKLVADKQPETNDTM